MVLFLKNFRFLPVELSLLFCVFFLLKTILLFGFCFSYSPSIASLDVLLFGGILVEVFVKWEEAFVNLKGELFLELGGLFE